MYRVSCMHILDGVDLLEVICLEVKGMTCVNGEDGLFWGKNRPI